MLAKTVNVKVRGRKKVASGSIAIPCNLFYFPVPADFFYVEL